MTALVKGLLLWLLCVAAGIISAIWMLLAVIVGSPRADVIALGFDQLSNAATGGDPDEYISSRAWRCRVDPRYARWVRVINWLFNDPRHCQSAYESERDRPPVGDEIQPKPADAGFFTSDKNA
jgi:hypothetical protein